MMCKNVSFAHVVLLVFLSLFLSGCIIIPTDEIINFRSYFPVNETNKIKSNLSTKKEILKLLGEPNLIRENNEIWVYVNKKITQTNFFIAIGFSAAGTDTTTTIKTSWLFLRFNKQEILIKKELFDKERACTTGGYCLLERDDGFSFELEKNIPYKIPPIPKDYCRYVIYYVYEKKYYYMEGYDTGKETKSLYVNGSERYSIEKDNFTYFDHKEGNITFTSVFSHDIKYDNFLKESKCVAGQVKYLELRAHIQHNWDKPTLVASLSEIEPDIAINILKERKLILQQ